MGTVAAGPKSAGYTGSIPPSHPTRQTLKCHNPDCGLNQYPLASRKCRRCHQPLDIPIIDPDPVIPDLSPLPVIPPAVCPALLGINRCFPVVIYWLRLRSGMSQEELSIAIDQPGAVGKGISYIENGRRMPTVRVLEKMAAALGTTPARICRMCEYLEHGK
jgi:hypothetical protein